jgi:cytochrome c
MDAGPMDSFELNKILGAVLGTLLITLSLNIVAGAMFSPHKPEKPGYDIVVTEPPAGGGTTAPQEEPIEQLLAKATPEKGASIAKKCLACHDFAKGGPNKVGPNLYGIVNRDRATHEGFSYTAAMKGKGGKWTIQDLNTYLISPRAFVPGTSMAFAGISKGSDRADLIAYLNTLADNPAPLPTAPVPAQGAAPKPQDTQAAAPKDEPKNAPPAQNAQPAKPAPTPAPAPAPKH